VRRYEAHFSTSF
jgi:hypothetical protein